MAMLQLHRDNFQLQWGKLNLLAHLNLRNTWTETLLELTKSKRTHSDSRNLATVRQLTEVQ